jgi:3-hydroxyisobutyrate dehydrogenase-like beta-hydroxyacid dehydrogenase
MALGFIGLGNMGLPMSRRLLAAGHQLVVCDVAPERVELLVAEGAEAAPTPAAVASRVETVLCSLPRPEILDAVALGEHGVADGGAVKRLVDLSTVGPDASRAVGERLAERGIALVDAPVSGGPGGAAAGTLAIMVGARPEEFDVVRPLLEVLGNPFVVGGEPGMGQVMKLANNYLAATALIVTSEAMVYGTKAGLDPAAMIEVINAGSGRNSASQDKFPRAILPGTFDYGFAMGLMNKDLGLFAADAEGRGVPQFVASAIRHYWQFVTDQRGENTDFTEIIRPMEEWAGVEVRANREAQS